MKKKKSSTIVSCSSLSGRRLDYVLSQLFQEYSRSYLKHLIQVNKVLINEKIVNKPDKKIYGSEKITIYPMLKNNECDLPENIFLNVIYEDNDILIINKPSGMVMHPGSGNKTGTVLNGLLYHYKYLKHVPRAGIIHRLDKDTSGLIVIAKNLISYNYLLNLLKKRKIIRKYQGVIKGNLISGGTINAPIMRHQIKRTCMMVHDLGKQSITHYKIINRFKFHTHISIKLETGRTHQIRVHMLHIKHPLVGDPLYGGTNRAFDYSKDRKMKKIFKFSRQALHADHISLRHPTSKNIMSWTVPLPRDMQELIFYL